MRSNAIDTIKSILLNVWSPELLTFPTPLLNAPANWLIPGVLWLAILRYVISLIRSEQLIWLWNQICRLTTYCQTSMVPALTYPTPRPLGNLMAEFAAVMIFSLFAVYFSLYGFVILLMVAAQHGKAQPLASLAVMILGLCIILVGRYYTVSALKTKLRLSELWVQYPKNRGVAVSAILVFTGVMVSLAWLIS